MSDPPTLRIHEEAADRGENEVSPANAGFGHDDTDSHKK